MLFSQRKASWARILPILRVRGRNYVRRGVLTGSEAQPPGGGPSLSDSQDRALFLALLRQQHPFCHQWLASPPPASWHWRLPLWQLSRSIAPISSGTSLFWSVLLSPGFTVNPEALSKVQRARASLESQRENVVGLLNGCQRNRPFPTPWGGLNPEDDRS